MYVRKTRYLKGIIAMLLAVILLWTGNQMEIQAAATYEQAVIYQTDFQETDAIEEWEKITGAQLQVLVSDDTNRFMKLIDDAQTTSPSHAATGIAFESISDRAIIAFDFMQPQNVDGYDNNSYGSFVLTSNGVILDGIVSHADDVLTQLFFVSTSLKYKDENLSGWTQKVNNSTYEPNTWHNIKIIVDFDTHQYDLYLDNDLKMTRAIKSTVDSINALSFRTSGKRKNLMYIDNLSVTQEAKVEDEEEDVFNIMRQNVVDYTTGRNDLYTPEEATADPFVSAYITDMDSQVAEYIETMDTAANRTYIWSDLDRIINNGEVWPKGAGDKRSDDTKVTFDRLKKMAIAYETVGSQYFQAQEVSDLIRDALVWLYHQDWYSEKAGVQTGGNWWDWYIGIPRSVLPTIMIVYDQLSHETIQHYIDAVNIASHNTNSTGANLIWTINKFIQTEILEEDTTQITDLINRLDSVFAYVTDGDGFYEDGSFIQHNNVSNTGNYGRHLIRSMGELLAMTKDTPWKLSSENYGDGVENIYGWIEKSFEPFIHEGALMDMVNGRQISSPKESNYTKGYDCMRAILDFVESAEEPYKSQYASMLKYWLQTDRESDNFYAYALPHYIMMARSILEDESIPSRGPLEGLYVAAGMDRIVQRDEHYAFALAMASNRVVNGENNNKENIKGWNHGSGVTYIYNDDALKYTNDFWPTVDPFRMPGTTAIYNEKFGMIKGSNSYAGGVKLGVEGVNYGGAGMIQDFNNSKLSSKKSWFMFDDEVVALGSDIDVTYPTNSVETIVENVIIQGDASNSVYVNGNEVLDVDPTWAQEVAVGDNSATPLSETSLNNVQWISYEGNVLGSGMGYYFPEEASLKAKKDARSYNYFYINQNCSAHEQHRRNYLTLWFDHGTNPNGEEYAYVMLPGQDEAQTASYAQNPDVQIVAQTNQVHAVEETELGLLAANFFTDNTVTVGDLTVNRRSSVIMEEKDGELTLSVCDPSQKNYGTMTITLHKSLGTVLAKDSRMTVNQSGETTVITVNMNGSLGRSFTARFPIQE